MPAGSEGYGGINHFWSPKLYRCSGSAPCGGCVLSQHPLLRPLALRSYALFQPDFCQPIQSPALLQPRLFRSRSSRSHWLLPQHTSWPPLEFCRCPSADIAANVVPFIAKRHLPSTHRSRPFCHNALETFDTRLLTPGLLLILKTSSVISTPNLDADRDAVDALGRSTAFRGTPRAYIQCISYY